MLKHLFLKIVKTKEPLMCYGFATFFIGITGIIISFVSFIRLIKIIKNLVKDKSYSGNEPYLAAAIITLILCISILIWGFKRLISGLKYTIPHYPPVPSEFEDYEEIKSALVRKKIPLYETGSLTIVKKDRSFITKFLFFLGFIILFLITINLLPDDLFWDYGVDSGYFSFPLLFAVILSTVAALRAASIYFHTVGESLETEVSEVIKSIKGGGNPYTLAPGIEKALGSIRQNGNPNIVFRAGFTGAEGGIKNTGRIEKKLFIETQPKPIAYEPHPIVYLYLLSAFILFIIGFFLMTRVPPGNISVLSDPTIAISYIWTIVKGCVLVFSGRGLMGSFFSISRTYRFESVMVYVEVEGIYGKVPVNGGRAAVDAAAPTGIIVRSDCLFKVYTTKLTTEIYTLQGKRHIIKMTVERDSEKAGELVAGAIEGFERDGVSVQGIETSSGSNGEDIAKLDLLDILKPAEDESSGES